MKTNISILGCLVMVSAMVFGNTNVVGIVVDGGTNKAIDVPSMNGFYTKAISTGSVHEVKGPQVTNYSLVVTNFTKEYKTIGSRATRCNQIGCLVYHCEPIYSPTDYYEIETVIDKTMLKYDCNGIIGVSCIKEAVISKRKREVNRVVIESVKTNDWSEVKEPVWLSITNYISYSNLVIFGYTNSASCIGAAYTYAVVTNWRGSDYWRNFIKE